MTSDAKHVEIGLTDKADAAARVFAELARRGIAPGARPRRRRRVRAARRAARQRLVAARARGAARDRGLRRPRADRRTGDGARVSAAARTAFVALLEDQLERRKRGDVPDVDDDPAWTHRRSTGWTRSSSACTSRCSPSPTGGSGRAVRRCSPILPPTPPCSCHGGYVGEGPESELAQGPDWTALRGRARRPGAATSPRPANRTAASRRHRRGRPALLASSAGSRGPPRAGSRAQPPATRSEDDRRSTGLQLRSSTHAGRAGSTVSAPTQPMSGQQAPRSRPRRRPASSASSPSTGRPGRAAGRPPTSSSRAIPTCSSRSASPSST